MTEKTTMLSCKYCSGDRLVGSPRVLWSCCYCFVECPNCGLEIGMCSSEEEAITAWNEGMRPQKEEKP